MWGNRFTVFSNNEPLENLNIKSRTDEALGDLTHYLLQFNVDVKYKPSITNIEADCLPRSPILKAIGGWFIGGLLMYDKFVFTERNKIRSGIHNTTFYKNNNIIYCKRKYGFKIVLSEECGDKLVEKTHLTYYRVGPKHILSILYVLIIVLKTCTKNFLIIVVHAVYVFRISRVQNEVRVFLGHLGPAKSSFEIMTLDTIGSFGGRRSTNVIYIF